jgi:site-specific DNA recombinase
MKAVVYARFSDDDLQRDESIEDQLRDCKARIEREGWTYVDHYADHGESGASLLLRKGVQALVQDALAKKFDIVVIEDLDRLSRDQEDTAAIYKRLQFAEIELYSLSDGTITELHVGLKSTMNAVELKKIGQKVRRGQRGRVAAGKIPGGNSYGYDVVYKFDGEGNPLRGDRVINEDEKRVINRIYEEYAVGHAPRAICARLNKEGVPSPSGRNWSQSTLNGNRRRGNGVLNNELYIGVIVYNRQRYIKNPDTGKRVARLNPESEWVRKEIPELRLVSDELWQSVKSRQKKLDERKPHLWKAQRPRNLFSYLLKCGECGSGFSMVSGTHVGCSGARNKGICENRKTMHREKLEQKVLGTLRTHLMDPDLCEEFCIEYTKRINQIRANHNASLSGYRAELKKLERERQKLVQSIKDGVPGSILKDDAVRIEKRKEELEDLLENTEEAPVLFHPNMAKRYHQEIVRLIESLNVEDHRAEAAELIRSLIDRVVLTRSSDRDELVIDLHGDLAGILAVATGQVRDDVETLLHSSNRKTFENTKHSQGMLVAGEVSQHVLLDAENVEKIDPLKRDILRNQLSEPLSQDMLGAGVGFEPTTFRL